MLPLRGKLDGVLQKAVPEGLRHQLLHLAHYPVLTGHPGGTRMYYTLRRAYYCPRKSSDVFSTVQNCQDCIRLREAHFKRQKLIKRFPAIGPLEFVAMDLFGAAKRTARGHNLIVVLTDRFPRMKRRILLRNTTAPTVTAGVLKYYEYKYRAPSTSQRTARDSLLPVL